MSLKFILTIVKNYNVVILIVIITGPLLRPYRFKSQRGSSSLQNGLFVIQQNVLLQQLRTEKQWLLDEVHNRGRNNLHTLSLLNHRVLTWRMIP
jgi:hypothetical protein